LPAGLLEAGAAAPAALPGLAFSFCHIGPRGPRLLQHQAPPSAAPGRQRPDRRCPVRHGASRWLCGAPRSSSRAA